jgi:hypothetical protein
VKTIPNCRSPNPADDTILCTKATHSSSSFPTLEGGVNFVIPSKDEGEFISSHDNERVTDSIASDRKAIPKDMIEEAFSIQTRKQ